MGSVIHDGSGTPGGRLTSLDCGGGSMPLLVKTECSGRLVPWLIWADKLITTLSRKGLKGYMQTDSPRLSIA
jgi:hypothetical protein